MENFSESKTVNLETFLFICKKNLKKIKTRGFLGLVEILIQEPSDYFLHDFRSFDKMEIFCFICLEVGKIDKEAMSNYEISYIQAIEYVKVKLFWMKLVTLLWYRTFWKYSIMTPETICSMKQLQKLLWIRFMVG